MKNKKHVLVIDDVSTNLRYIGEILKEEYTLSLAKSGAQAFKMLEKITPNLILLDVKMPQMDGFEVFKQLLSKEETKNIPTVFLSADNQEDTENRVLSMGARGFIRKPFDPQMLIDIVRQFASEG